MTICYQCRLKTIRQEEEKKVKVSHLRRTRDAAAVVLGDEIAVEICVDRVVVRQFDHLLESVINKDKADESREALLCETGKILHQEAGVRGDQHQTEYTRPQADPQPELKVVKVIVSEEG